MKSRVEEVHGAIERLKRLAQLFGQRRSQLAQEAGLTEAQWRVLEEIVAERFMPSMFARDRESSPAAVSRIIRQLLQKKLVSVSVAPDDGRQRRYVLTPRGQRVLDGLHRSRRKAIDAVWMDLDGAELQAFTRFSGELITRLEDYATQRASRRAPSKPDRRAG